MKTNFSKNLSIATVFLLVSNLANANLLTNGGFEDSSSGFTTPPGWTNIGPTNGVVPYAAVASFGLLPFEGLNFYTLGGLGTNGISSIGVGISQSVATDVGNTYRLTFGLSDENGPGLETVLGVNIGGALTQFTLTADNSGFFARQLTSQVIEFVATGLNTAISFTLLATNETGIIGNNDPLIDGVNLELINVAPPPPPPAGVPEPATLALLSLGLLGLSRRTAVAQNFIIPMA